MSFAHPLLLASGLAAIALPILIHILMRRRRRPTRWAAMRFLLEAYKRQRQRVRFEQWLLLLARCLIVLVAALAIARPTIPGVDPLMGARATTLYLLIDNSLTAAHSSPSALEGLKQRAYDLLDRLDSTRGDRAAVYALASPAQGLIAPPTTATASASAQIADLAPADSPADLHGALSQVSADISQSGGGSRSLIVVLSEFRAGSAPIEEALPALAESGTPDIVLAASPPAEEGLTNLALTGLEPVRAIILAGADDSTTQVRARGTRVGPGVASGAAVPVQLFVRGEGAGTAIGGAVLNFAPGATEAEAAISIDPSRLAGMRREAPGAVVLEARLPPADGLWRDNARLGVIDRRASIEVGLIAPPRFGPRPSVANYRPADWVEAALDPEGLRDAAQIRVRAVPPGAVDAATLAGLQAAVVAEPQGLSTGAWEALRHFADLGGLVVIFAQPTEGAQVWTDDARAALGVGWELGREPISLESAAITRPVVVPALLALVEGELTDLLRPVSVSRALPPMLREADDAQTLLALGDGRPLMVAAVPGAGGGSASARGLVVYCGVALDLTWSDLPTKPLLLPLMQEIVRQGVSAARGNWTALAGQTPVAAPGSVELRWETPPAPGAPTVIPLHPSGVSRQAIRHAGLLRGVDATGGDRGVVAINPDTRASDTTPRSRQEVAAWLETTGLSPPIWLEEGASVGDADRAGAAQTRRDWALLPVLFGLALALALGEAIAARAFSHASVGKRAGAPGGGA